MLVLLYGAGRYAVESDLAELRMMRDDLVKLAVEDVELGMMVQDEQVTVRLEEETA